MKAKLDTAATETFRKSIATAHSGKIEVAIGMFSFQCNKIPKNYSIITKMCLNDKKSAP